MMLAAMINPKELIKIFSLEMENHNLETTINLPLMLTVEEAVVAQEKLETKRKIRKKRKLVEKQEAKVRKEEVKNRDLHKTSPTV